MKPGDNVYTFNLPATLNPVRTQLDFEGQGKGQLYPNFGLIVALPEAPYTEVADYYFPGTGHTETSAAFWSLPGQWWTIGVSNYEIEGGKYGKVTVAPTKDETIRLKLSK